MLGKGSVKPKLIQILSDNNTKTEDIMHDLAELIKHISRMTQYNVEVLKRLEHSTQMRFGFVAIALLLIKELENRNALPLDELKELENRNGALIKRPKAQENIEVAPTLYKEMLERQKELYAIENEDIIRNAIFYINLIIDRKAILDLVLKYGANINDIQLYKDKDAENHEKQEKSPGEGLILNPKVEFRVIDCKELPRWGDVKNLINPQQKSNINSEIKDEPNKSESHIFSPKSRTNEKKRSSISEPTPKEKQHMPIQKKNKNLYDDNYISDYKREHVPVNKSIIKSKLLEPDSDSQNLSNYSNKSISTTSTSFFKSTISNDSIFTTKDEIPITLDIIKSINDLVLKIKNSANMKNDNDTYGRTYYEILRIDLEKNINNELNNNQKVINILNILLDHYYDAIFLKNNIYKKALEVIILDINNNKYLSPMNIKIYLYEKSQLKNNHNIQEKMYPEMYVKLDKEKLFNEFIQSISEIVTNDEFWKGKGISKIGRKNKIPQTVSDINEILNNSKLSNESKYYEIQYLVNQSLKNHSENRKDETTDFYITVFDCSNLLEFNEINFLNQYKDKYINKSKLTITNSIK